MTPQSAQFSSIHPEGCEICLRSLVLSQVFDIPEADCEALANDEMLRDLLRHWSTLDKATTEIICTIVQSRTRSS